jgi:enoyl-CoA hydratase/carnithine racemase
MTTSDAPVTREHFDGIAWITLNRPDKRNALDSEGRTLLTAAFGEAAADNEVRVVVLTGNGGAFSAGVDLSDAPVDERHVLAQDQTAVAAPLEDFPKPVIAAVDGPAVGGGFELALAADMRVATKRSFFALTEVRIGSLPGSGGTQRLFSAVPSAVAWHLILTGDRLPAQRAYEVGLVSHLIGEETFRDEVVELASRVATAAPLSLRAAKLAGQAGLSRAGGVGMALERSLWAFLSTTEDRAEGRAAFREKRSPDFKGR